MFLCRRPLLHRLCILHPRLLFTHLNKISYSHIPRLFISTNSADSLPSKPGQDADVFPSNAPNLRQYMDFRAKGAQTLAPTTLVCLMNEAVEAEDKLALVTIANDLLRLPDTPTRNGALRQLLIHTNHRLLLPNVVRKIFQAFAWNGKLDKVSSYNLKLLTYQIAVEYARTPFGRDFSAVLYTTIVGRMEHLERAPVGAESVNQELPYIVDAAFELLYYLILLKNERLALELFQILTERLYISPEAVQLAPTSTKDFDYIISVTLARSCLYWHKRDLLLRLLLRYLPSDNELEVAMRQKNLSLDPNSNPESPPPPTHFHQSLDPSLLDLITETLYASFRNPNAEEMRRCVDVITRIHLLAPVQNALIRLAYTAAVETRMGAVARRLYAFTREPAVEAEHRYAAPQGQALLFLMTFLTEEKGNSHLARTLADEVAQNKTFLPVQDRAKFLALTVSQGFGISARTLWERYAIGKDSMLITGNSALLMKMVRLFSRMVRSLEADLPNVDGEQATAAEEPTEEEAEGLPERTREMVTRAQNIRAFVQKVIGAFLEAHKPLDQAQHTNLTTLARAYFVAGSFDDGFKVFRTLIRRREVPDLYDINIGLSALAEHRPVTAAKMIQVMLERGIQPDSVTFGTVIHHALAHGNMELVGNLLKQARTSNIQLSRQGLFSLTRATVAMEEGLGKSKVEHLRDALAVLEAMPEQGRLSSPDMGKFMVFAALREGEGTLAFKFWKLLLKFSAEWEDGEQVFIRRLLRKRILETRANYGAMKELRERPPYHAKK
ncbi:hypothetical protein D9757_003434 [Collybiopsis confluens]|uniref:Pentatricopeptide repeat-containing protein n=1 Tax=Collybiopsis confluens TaxID=2823264 RepID=A0A8H5HTT2_9AGAR|nr:hypothetical protein D9757_003434 [Collybiopsis confluens]